MLEKRACTCPRSATQSDRHAGRDLEIETSQHTNAGSSGVPEVNVFESHVSDYLLSCENFAFVRFGVNLGTVIYRLEHGSAALLGLGCIWHELEDVPGLKW
jgi:hypothetical protein